MTSKSAGVGWSGMEMVGLLVIAAGAAFLAYSIYSYFSVPAVSIPHGFNASSFGGNFVGRGGGNFTRGGNFSRSGAGADFVAESFGTPFILRIGDVLSGILAVLLGVVLFKYGGLKKKIRA